MKTSLKTSIWAAALAAAGLAASTAPRAQDAPAKPQAQESETKESQTQQPLTKPDDFKAKPDAPQPVLDDAQPKTVLDKPQPKTILDEPKSKAVLDEPQPKAILDKSQPTTLLDEPGPKTVLDQPQPKTVLDDPQPKTVLDKPQNKTIFDEPKLQPSELKSVPERRSGRGGDQRGWEIDIPVRSRGDAEPNVQERCAAAIAAYQAAEGQEKETTKATLRTRLVEVFEADMKLRKEQADQIDARLKKLREQYQSREAAKDSIIELQLQVIEKDAGGLGFPSASNGQSPAYGAGMRVLVPYAARLDNRQLLPGGSGGWPPPGWRSEVNSEAGKQKKPLEQLKREQPALVSELTKIGHFLESPDGKFYVYANVNRPNGPSEILAVDSQTGKVLAVWEHPLKAIGKLLLSKDDILTQEEDGATHARIRHSTFASRLSGNSASSNRSSNSTNDGSLNPASAPPGQAPAPGGGYTPTTTSDQRGLMEEHEWLRVQYQSAKAILARFNEEQIKADLENARKQRGAQFTAEFEKEFLDSYKTSRPRHQAQFEHMTRLLEAKLALLKLDVEAATTALVTAESKLREVQEKNAGGAGSATAVDQQMGAVRAAQIQVQRARTVLELFESIKNESIKDHSINDQSIKAPAATGSTAMSSEKPSTLKSSSSAPSRTAPREIPKTRPLVDLKKEQPSQVEQLTKAGHFAESSDGQYYTYANSNHPAGPSEIFLVNAANGELLTIWTMEGVPGKLRFTVEGVATEEADGSTRLRITYPDSKPKLPTGQADRDRSESPAGGANPLTQNPSGGAAAAQNEFITEYEKLRNAYHSGQQALRSIERDLQSLKEAEKSGEWTKEKIEKERDRKMQSMMLANSPNGRVYEAERMLSTKINLLKLDVDEATLKLQDAESKVKEAHRINTAKPGAVNEAAIQSLTLKAKTAQVQLDRAKAMLQLFESIKNPVQPQGTFDNPKS